MFRLSLIGAFDKSIEKAHCLAREIHEARRPW